MGHTPNVQKSDSEWRTQLSPQQVCRLIANGSHGYCRGASSGLDMQIADIPVVPSFTTTRY